MKKYFTGSIIFSVMALLLLPVFSFSQIERKAAKNGDVGMFSFGVRSTISNFSSGNRNYAGTGVGGHLRFKMAKNLILESFGDYMLTNVRGLAQRMDVHGGFSFAPYLFSSTDRAFLPYPVAGFCVDYSKFVKMGSARDSGNDPKFASRYSFATQIGLGCHFRITEKLDFTPLLQYMFHIGNEVNIDITDNNVTFIEEKKGQLEGHFLFTMSVNYKVVDLW